MEVTNITPTHMPGADNLVRTHRGCSSQQRAAVCQVGAESPVMETSLGAWNSTQVGPCFTQCTTTWLTVTPPNEPGSGRQGGAQRCLLHVQGSGKEIFRAGPLPHVLLVELNIDQGDTVARQKQKVL